MNTERTEKFVNAIACDLEEGGFRQVSGTTLRRTLATAVSAALPLLAEQQGVALRYLTQRELDSIGSQAEGMDGEQWDRWVQAKFAEVNGLATVDSDGFIALAATGKQQVVKKEHWLDRMAAIEGRIEPSAREMEGMDEEQVGEVQGDALDEVGHASANRKLLRTVRAQRDRITELEAALAARQPGAQVPVVCTDEDLLGELDEAADHGATLSVTYLRELAKRSAAALRTADPVMFAHATNLQAGLEVAERYGDDLRRQLKDAAVPAQGIDLGQFREAVVYQRDAFKHYAPYTNNPEYGRILKKCDHLLTLIDQRDAAPGVGQ